MNKKTYEKHTSYFDVHIKPIVDMSHTTRIKSIKPYLKKDNKILDIGCGYGAWLYTFERMGLLAYGIDLSQKRVEQCKEYGLNALVCDITKEDPFDKESFDIVFVNHVFEHLEKEDRTKVMKSIYNWLRPNGVVISITPHNQDLEDSAVVCPECGNKFNWQGHVNSFKQGELKLELESSGFKTLEEFVIMSLPLGSILPRPIIKSVCKILLKKGYDVGQWEIITICKKTELQT